MRLVVKLAAYAIVLTIATVVAFASGICEEVCDANNTACTNAASSAYNQCSQAAATQSANCYQTVDTTYGDCMQQADSEHMQCIGSAAPEEEGICNQLQWMAYNSCEGARQEGMFQCMTSSGVGQEQCEFNFQMDQQACANDYDNCLFICSVQNP